MKNIKKENVGILGFGEIGKAVSQICEQGGYNVYVRELNYDNIKGKSIDYLHVSIPEKNNDEYVEIVSKAIVEVKPKLTIINSSVTPGTTRAIYKKTKALIVHSPVIGVHPHLYESIRYHFPKIVGPINIESLQEVKKHFKKLKLKIEVYDSPEESESAKLIDLIYYAWNIIFCKWVNEVCEIKGLNFDQVYTRHNEIYNEGYKKLRSNVVRPILKPMPGPIGGHCTVPDAILYEKYLPNRLTKFIIKENERYEKESK